MDDYQKLQEANRDSSEFSKRAPPPYPGLSFEASAPEEARPHQETSAPQIPAYLPAAGYPNNVQHIQHSQPIFNINAGGAHAQLPSMGPDPARITCPGCHQSIKSKVTKECKTKAHLWALCLFLFGCWCFCCCPYCMQSCKIHKHKCPNCKTYLGTFAY